MANHNLPETIRQPVSVFIKRTDKLNVYNLTGNISGHG